MEKLFNSKIYTNKAIKATVAAFCQLAEFELAGEGEYIKVRVAKLLDPEVESQLMDEFGNYALYHTIAEKKQWQ
jgi:hypothetical protein